MHCTTHEAVDAVTLVVVGAVDVHTVAAFRERVCVLVDSGRRVDLDLGGVTFLDAVGLGVLVGAHRRAGRAGSVLTIRAVSSGLRELLRSTRLDTVLDIGQPVA